MLHIEAPELQVNAHLPSTCLASQVHAKSSNRESIPGRSRKLGHLAMAEICSGIILSARYHVVGAGGMEWRNDGVGVYTWGMGKDGVGAGAGGGWSGRVHMGHGILGWSYGATVTFLFYFLHTEYCQVTI